ncbi:MAG: hypothetical protein AAF911_14030 [Planctomycetota bacterium]
MLHQALNRSAAGPMVPLIVMPDSADDPRAWFDRVAAAAEAALAYPVMLIGPDLSDPQAMEGWPATFAKLGAEHDLAERGLVMGHGAGARLAQYFALEHPQSVLACAALSADAWASVDDVEDGASLDSVRWLIGCGTQTSAGAMRRAELFQIELAEAGCAVDFLDWDGDETVLPEHAIQNTMHFFADLTRDVHQAA